MKRWEVDDLAFESGAATIGQIGDQMYVELYGETLQINMPDDIRLCRLVESATESVPADIAQTIRKLIDYGIPLGCTNADWNKWRGIVYAWLEQQEER